MNLLVISERAYEHKAHFDLVYEWEDELLTLIPQLHLYKKREIVFRDKHLLSFIENKMGVNPNSWWTNKYECFHFDMNAQLSRNFMNAKNHSVCIIDFFLKEKELSSFYTAYNKVNRLFVSSREVYDFLLKHNPEREVLHMPLTLPDKYRIDLNKHFEKKYDIVLIGRQSPLLMTWLKEYEKAYPVTYVYRGKWSNGNYPYYTNKGEYVGNIISRKDYFDLMRQGKIVFYSTPGMDGGEYRTNGFNQVTPRFLEALSCGCNIISRFEDNPDTDFFELNKMSTNVKNYKEFMYAMKMALETGADIKKYADYLERHYTSNLVNYFY